MLESSSLHHENESLPDCDSERSIFFVETKLDKIINKLGPTLDGAAYFTSSAIKNGVFVDR